MRAYLIIFFVLSFASGRGQGVVGRVIPPDYNTQIDKGTFVPTDSASGAMYGVARHKVFKYGWLICYGMNTYNGHFWDEANQVPPPATMFNTTNVNVQKWADTAAVHGIQYAALTVMNEYGFMLWPSEVQYNMPRISLSSGFSPYYTAPYCVQTGTADTTIVTKFVNGFAAKGIEPVFYVAVAWNQNLRQVSSGQLWPGIDSTRQELFVQYYCKVVQELARKYPKVKYFWLDMAAPMPQANVQRIYNAIKSVNPTITVIGNVQNDASFAKFPYDVASVEEYIAYNSPGIVASNYRSFGGTTYYIGQEIVGTPYSTYSQWYYYDDLCPDQPVTNPLGTPAGYVKMSAVAPSTFQGLVNNAYGYNRPFLAAMLVDRNGNLVQENLDYLRQIIFQ